ncbi:hypothetical protein CLAFUW4_20051 [Fulvia fulva]|uniref:uncharacterized protein n=1 Tax=Passalora fulva TaxID=5499 RepID=UPI002852A4EE|nr:uncharacterized protein CLAFUR5_20051 [Fulvia fulva]KAK4624042.1 hypothetical protein CLAFUR4_20051 [Fulvia fulva]KAK4625968.1 hypothetical protein CLAFUR0_20051 [Fulvia fulva]WMI38910.1 hypothetical protein CLAFUR5_20051 [Fulvia fulva]WPV15135.1 hypothetical protein CLAFUW4_20051 [Fulvia fulva]WPV29930.1 hypothetical protein CLAFUW7_20051 [Fulvia fulva]
MKTSIYPTPPPSHSTTPSNNNEQAMPLPLLAILLIAQYFPMVSASCSSTRAFCNLNCLGRRTEPDPGCLSDCTNEYLCCNRPNDPSC